jgi:peptidoglycan hydrolase-like protein with peptidoglycan-binding domain
MSKVRTRAHEASPSVAVRCRAYAARRRATSQLISRILERTSRSAQLNSANSPSLTEEEEQRMVQITTGLCVPQGLISGDEAARCETELETGSEPTQEGGIDDACQDPVARFATIFGAPPRALQFFADKDGGGSADHSQGSQASSTPSAFHAPTLRRGESGPAVRALQHQLNQWRAAQSPPQHPVPENGRFTAETEQAVKEFRQATHLQSGGPAGARSDGIADLQLQGRLRLENDPAFNRLDPKAKDAARQHVAAAGQVGKQMDPLFDLLAVPGLDRLSGDAQLQMIHALSAPSSHIPGTLGSAQLIKEFAKLAASAEFRKLDGVMQATVVARLATLAHPSVSFPGSGMPRAAIDDLVKVATSEKLTWMAPGDRLLVLKALEKNPGDRKLANNILSLLNSFSDLSAKEKTAVLSQVANYPDHRSVGYIERMLAKDWFKDQDLADKQRSLKTIAYLAQHDGGDRELVDNTLDQLVGENSDMVLGWDNTLPADVSGRGLTKTHTILLDPNHGIAADNNPVPVGGKPQHLVLHTIAHELNHVLNGDEFQTGTADHFAGEFRAWAVGFKTEHGHWPTNEEAMHRVREELTTADGSYADIKKALYRYVDGDAILRFVSQVTGLRVTRDNLGAALKTDPSTWHEWDPDPEQQDLPQRERTAPMIMGNIDNR